jgi:hypothetical protein
MAQVFRWSSSKAGSHESVICWAAPIDFMSNLKNHLLSRDTEAAIVSL